MFRRLGAAIDQLGTMKPGTWRYMFITGVLPPLDDALGAKVNP
jgi:hypothetical protein